MEPPPPPPPPPEAFAPQRAAPSPEVVSKVLEKIHKHFSPTVTYFREENAVECRLPIDLDVKQNFVKLVADLKELSYLAVVRKTEYDLQLIAFRRPEEKGRRASFWPIGLLVASIVVVIVDGYFRSYIFAQEIKIFWNSSLALNSSFLYMAALIGIIGVHELGHKVASYYHGMRSSWPYFIPGIPLYSIAPTFGAVITAKDPPVNRDSLFDLGISGPLAGLCVALGVAVVATYNATVTNLGGNCAFPSQDFFTQSLGRLFHSVSSTQTLCYNPMGALLYLAYSIGFLITFINLFPAWQLDGGHIANSVVRRYARSLTLISALLMVLLQFWLMALLILLLSSRAPSLRPLDDVSPVTNWRKVGFVLTLLLAVFLFFGTLWYNGAIQLYPYQV